MLSSRLLSIAALCTLPSSPSFAANCADLAKLTIPAVAITSAADVRQGQFVPPDSATPLQVPQFCRIVAVAKPTPDSLINFEVWIPTTEEWNRNLKGIGNGGYTGAIQYGRLAEAVKRGFAAVSTDTGHTGEDLSFAAAHPEKIIDWGYRAVHIMTESAKRIVREYFGAPPKHSYFVGCSTGGHQALSEVQRFPADYDGVVAGDPGNNRVHLNVGFLWAFAATHDANGKTILPSSKLGLINKAVVAACDLQDGLKDGIISNPPACHFDPITLLCKGEENESCLTRDQVEAVRKIYAGPRDPQTGAQIIAGYSPGSESPVDDNWAGGWRAYITDRKEPMRLDFWKYWVFDNPRWDWRTFDYHRDVAFADSKSAAVNATATDLTAFQSRGGKLLMYSGWADPVGPPMDAVNYYQRVVQTMGGKKNTDPFFRLFMVPGMAHCGGGPAPNVFGGYGPSNPSSPELQLDADHDVLSAVVEWVERGSAPNYFIASHITNGHIDRARPVCAYPQIAHWNGRGSSDDAGNFSCVADPNPPANRK